jgi:hypothetical protein
MIKKFPKKRIPSTLLALVFDGAKLEGNVVRRTNGSLKILQSFSAGLKLNPLNSDPELVGREIKNNLEQAGVKERNCIVCVPLTWALAMQVKVPAIPDADIPSFLEIEAERGFPYAPETLLIAQSLCDTTEGEKLASLVAMPRNHMLQLEKALRAAQLKPLSFTLGITALHSAEADTNRGTLAIAVGENTVDLQITCNSGVAVLRSLDSAIETEGSQRSIDADGLAREVRVTLGQLPMELRGAVNSARLFGSSELAQKFISEIRPKLEAMRMRVDVASTYPADAFRSQYPVSTTVAPGLSAAARYLTAAYTPFEFLPPKVSAWQQITARVSSRKLGTIGAAAAVIILATGGAVGAREYKLSKLRSQWVSMETKVKELEDMQTNIRKFRPWFDESFPSLSILRRVTEAFPEQGTVWAKTVEIRNQSQVTCSGTARNSPALTKVLNQLHASMDSMRGNSPSIQFTFNFNYSPEETK